MVKVDISTTVRTIIAKNPNLTQDQMRVLVRDTLEEMKAQGAKISSKQMAQANALVSEATAQQSQVAFQTRVPKNETRKAVEQLNKQQAHVAYQEAMAEPPKSVDTKIEPPKNNRAARRQNLIEGMIDTEHMEAGTFTQHLEELEEQGKIAERNAALEEMHRTDVSKHKTRKQKKLDRKKAEVRSRNEHQKYRRSMTKDQRDARYCTKNGILRTEGRKALEKVKTACTGEGNIIPEIRIDRSAQESWKAFEQAGMIPEAVSTGVKSGEKAIEVGVKTTSKLSKFGKFGAAAAAIAGIFYLGSELVTKNKEKVDVKERNEDLKLSA